MLISETGGQLCDEFIICPEIEFWVHEEHVEFLLELLDQIILHDSHLHVGRKGLVELVVEQESIGTDPKVRQRMQPPFLDDISSYPLIRR